MRLAEYQAALLAQLLGDAAHGAPALGAPERVMLYRAMVQRRLIGLARSAYRSLAECVGLARFDASFARFLAAQPPSSPLLRDVVLPYAGFIRDDRALLACSPAFVPDLALFEARLWQTAYVATSDVPVVALDFAAPPAFLASASVFRAAYPVQRVRAAKDYNLPRLDSLVWVYRDEAGAVRFAATTPLVAEIFLSAQPAEASLTACVTRAAERLGRAIDDTLLEELSEGITAALQLGVLRGSLGQG